MISISPPTGQHTLGGTLVDGSGMSQCAGFGTGFGHQSTARRLAASCGRSDSSQLRSHLGGISTLMEHDFISCKDTEPTEAEQSADLLAMLGEPAKLSLILLF